jgi:predicted MFS family arabinose efflux permease
VISVLRQLQKQLREADLTNFRELKRGWRFVLGAFVGIGGGFASLYFYTAGLFIKPLAAEFGWSRSEASLGALSFTIGNVIALPIVGRLVDRYGEIPVAFISGQLLALSFLMLGLFTQGLASFLFLVAVLTLISAGSNAIGYNRIIVRHFVEQRGLALGLALTGTAFGAAFLPSWLAPFIAEHGWRPAYFTLAVLAAVMACVAALLLREKSSPQAAPSTPQALLSWREICSHPAFLPIALMIFLSSTAVLGTTLHMIPLLSDGGMSPTQAGATAAALGVAVIVGRVLSGHLLDRWDAGWVAFFLLAFSGMGALLLWTGLPQLAVAGAALIGFGVGTEGDLLAYLLSRRFPIRNFGSVYGTIFAVHAFGAGVGGVFAGGLYDATGGYSAWLLVAASALFMAGAVALATERGVRKMSEPEALEV